MAFPNRNGKGRTPRWPPRSSDFPPLGQEHLVGASEEEADEADEEPFSADIGVVEPEEGLDAPIVLVEKVICTKTKVFDALMRIDPQIYDVDLTSDIQVADQYEPAIATQPMMTEMALRQEFQTDGTARYDDELFQTRIIGWSDSSGKIYTVNPIHLGDVHQDLVPLTESIFPVMVMGPNLQPCDQHVVHQAIYDWQPNLYLVLDDMPGQERYMAQVSVYKLHSLWRFNVYTYRGALTLCRIYIDINQVTAWYHKYFFNYGKINRILDLNNAALGIYGMYAGGPIPGGTPGLYSWYRLCYDHPHNLASSDFGLHANTGVFRTDNDYQPGAIRVGYFMTRDAHLVVTEVASWGPNFPTLEHGPAELHVPGSRSSRRFGYRTLMNEGTYVVCDGYSTYSFDHCLEFKKQSILITDVGYHVRGLSPRLVFATEGINALNICHNTYKDNFRNSRFFSARTTEVPIVVSWTIFQQAFDLNYHPPTEAQDPLRDTRHPGEAFEQVMAQRDFTDYLTLDLPFTPECRRLLFALNQTPIYVNFQNRYDENYCVYGLLREDQNQADNNLYFYLGHIRQAFFPRADGGMRFDRTYFHGRRMPPEIDRQKYPNLTDQDQRAAEAMMNMFRNVVKIPEYKQFTRAILPNLRHSDFNNPALFTFHRTNRLKMIFPEADQEEEEEGTPQQGTEQFLEQVWGPPKPLHQVMHLNDFSDFMYANIPTLSHTVVLVFADEPRILWRYPDFQESWHVYALFKYEESDPLQSWFVYLHTLRNVYRVEGDQLWFIQTRFDYQQLFLRRVTRQTHQISEEDEQAVNRLYDVWSHIVTDNLFYDVMRNLPARPRVEMNSQSQLTRNRFKILDEVFASLEAGDDGQWQG